MIFNPNQFSLYWNQLLVELQEFLWNYKLKKPLQIQRVLMKNRKQRCQAYLLVCRRQLGDES